VRRVLRILLNVGAVVSIALGAAAVFLWARSYRHFDDYDTLNLETRTIVFVRSLRGGLQVAKMDDVSDSALTLERLSRPGWQGHSFGAANWPLARRDDDVQLLDWDGAATKLRGLGFRLSAGTKLADARFWSVRIPYGFLVLLALPLPAWRLLRCRRHRRSRTQGHCPASGYDLRATPDRCPECGRVPREPRGLSPVRQRCAR
jgi:hypothetical protein